MNMNMNANMNKLALAIGALAMAGGAMAAASTSTMGVTASVAAACSVGDGGTMALGPITMLSAVGTQTTTDTTATAAFPAICTKGTPIPTFTYVSTNVDGANNFRLIGGSVPGDLITYTLYQSPDSDGTPIGSGLGAPYPGFVIDGTSQSLVLTAKIAQAAKSGKSVQSYADTITITVTFS
jgi:spore coat protein U-like protein